MALEKGGRADKIGNRYENRILAKQLFALLLEKLRSVEVEPLGEEGEGVEYICTALDGTRKYYQCKVSNGSQQVWNFGDLNAFNLFHNIKSKFAIPNAEFHFISPLSYGDAICDLCDRARMNHSVDDFLNEQMDTSVQKTTLRKFEKYFGLSQSDRGEMQQLVDILSRCYFEQIPDSGILTQDFELLIAYHLSGEASTTRMLLENYVNDEKRYGIELSSYDVSEFLRSKGIQFKDYGKDETVISRIRELNHIYWRTFSPINEEYIPRHEVDIVCDHLENERSVVLHGKAGTGKSGCVELICRRLESDGISYLRVKLDDYVPKNNTVEFGKQLGLPDSPILCLERVNAGQPCVLILDQLDTVRWTTVHSPAALLVCKALIKEMQNANQNCEAHISMMFVTRTFDYKHSSDIRQLFDESDENKVEWENVEVCLLSENDVIRVVGEHFRSMSAKLRQMLKNPSSLYVWSMLDEPYQIQSITTSNQLIQAWEEQIIKRCARKNCSSTKVQSFVENLARRMSELSVFSLPSQLYSAETTELAFLCSEGLLTHDETRISFAHQSFLDFFIVNENLGKILSGMSIIDVIGGRDQQTPNLRYRFLILLQVLLDYDSDIFIRQSTLILNSDSVRYYYQCAVFDAMGQQETPSKKLLSFAWKYWNDPMWKDYIREVVILGSPAFVKHMKDMGYNEWLSEEGIALLRSISEENPDYVVSIIEPYCFQNEKQDRECYSCLCFDVDCDSEAMYQLRMKLLQKHPKYLESFWTNFYHLFESGSQRTIDYILLVLEYHDAIHLHQIHFPDEKTLLSFAQKNYEAIIERVIPQLLDMTDGMADSIHENTFSKEYSKWIQEKHDPSILRLILYMASIGAIEYAKQKSAHFMEVMFTEKCSGALVGNELILNAIEQMPILYANEIISWLVHSFPKHIFDYTGSPDNYLSTVKRVIANFSSHCTHEIYDSLEQTICGWKDPLEQMLCYLTERIERNKEQGGHSVYYAYWGYMQKELLPEMDQIRLSITARELLATVNRNPWIHLPHYWRGFSVGEVESVVSAVAGKEDRISDKVWLQIINTPNEKMHRHFCRASGEATHMEFADAMSKQAKKQPERFAKLSLQFPDECYQGYISAVLRALCRDEVTDNFGGTELTCDVIRKFSSVQDGYILSCMANIVQNRSGELWPDDILSFLERMAMLSSEEFPARYGAAEQEEPRSAQAIYNMIYNSPQGDALLAIQQLLFDHWEIYDRFKSLIARLIHSETPFVRLAALECIIPCYNIDEQFAYECFREALKEDACTLLLRQSWEILSRDYKNIPDFYREHLLSALKSTMGDICEISTAYICALAVYENDEVLYSAVTNDSFTDKQASRICSQATTCYQYEAHRERSKEIILYVVEHYAINAHSLSPDFFKENIVIERDREFMLALVNSASKERLLYSIIMFLSKTDGSIVAFADVILEVVKKASMVYQSDQFRLGLEELIRGVAHLYDEGKEDHRIRTICLDAWDELFKFNIHDVKSLSVMVDDLS